MKKAVSINWRHLELDDVTSTNDTCFDKCRSGEGTGLWITANRQLGGRGRRGRQWTSEPGNLYASLLLINPADQQDLGTLPLVAAIAANIAISKVLPNVNSEPKIKWPNDVLIGGSKVCGILLEAERLTSQDHAVVLGFGVNIAHHPEHALYKTTAINALGTSISPQQLFAHLFNEMKHVLEIWDQGRGISAIRDLWVENAAGIGNDIKVNLPNKVLHGRFVGLADDGNLILRQDNGEQIKIAAGDVFLLDT